MTYLCEECGHEDEKGGVHCGRKMMEVEEETPKEHGPHWECSNCGHISHEPGTHCNRPMQEA